LIFKVVSPPVQLRPKKNKIRINDSEIRNENKLTQNKKKRSSQMIIATPLSSSQGLSVKNINCAQISPVKIAGEKSKLGNDFSFKSMYDRDYLAYLQLKADLKIQQDYHEIECKRKLLESESLIECQMQRKYEKKLLNLAYNDELLRRIRREEVRNELDIIEDRAEKRSAIEYSRERERKLIVEEERQANHIRTRETFKDSIEFSKSMLLIKQNHSTVGKICGNSSLKDESDSEYDNHIYTNNMKN